MQSFLQYVEALWNRPELIPDNSSKSLGSRTKFLGLTTPKEQCVKFCLYCVKDCLSNSDSKSAGAKKAILLAQEWLKNPKSRYKIETKTAGIHQNLENYSYPDHAAYWLILVLNSPADDWMSRELINYSSTCGEFAVLSFPPELRNQKEQEYLGIANSMKSRTTLPKQPYKYKFDNFDIILNYLIDEMGEDIIVKRGNKFYLNMPGSENYGFDNMQDILNNISKNSSNYWKFARNFIRKLYINSSQR